MFEMLVDPNGAFVVVRTNAVVIWRGPLAVAIPAYQPDSAPVLPEDLKPGDHPLVRLDARVGCTTPRSFAGVNDPMIDRDKIRIRTTEDGEVRMNRYPGAAPEIE